MTDARARGIEREATRRGEALVGMMRASGDRPRIDAEIIDEGPWPGCKARITAIALMWAMLDGSVETAQAIRAAKQAVALYDALREMNNWTRYDRAFARWGLADHEQRIGAVSAMIALLETAPKAEATEARRRAVFHRVTCPRFLYQCD